jgi:hypothetical protein
LAAWLGAAARSRGQGWPEATRRAAALTPARTVPRCIGGREPEVGASDQMLAR